MNLETVVAVRNNKTIYRDGDLNIKVFSQDYSKADVLNEALNQALLEETSLNIPHIREVMTIDGKWAIVSDYIEGKTLNQLIFENPERRDEYMDLFVDLQLRIHAETCPGLKKLKDKMNAKIDLANLDATSKYELHTRLEGMPKHTKVCHGDFNYSNIILTPDGVPYILDWAHATQGNASADAARTYLLFWLSGDITGADRYLNLFCEKSHTDRRYVQKWMPIVAASQSVKGNLKERQFLLSWVNVMDYE